MQKILVTGSNGFIGSHLVEKLCSENSNHVRCLVRESSDLNYIEKCKKECFVSDFKDNNGLKEAVKDVDIIYHLGGLVRANDYNTLYEVNSSGTKNLVEAVKEVNPDLKMFVYVSSQAAWGTAESGGPVSHYGKSKRDGEEFVKTLNNYIIIRPVAVYGPRDKDFLPVFKMAKKGLFLVPKGAGNLNFIYIDDCIKGILQEHNENEVFLSDGTDYSWKDVKSAFENVLNRNIISIIVPKFLIRIIGFLYTILGKMRRKPHELNNDKVAEILAGNWIVPKNSVIADNNLSIGFKKTYDWYLNEGLL